MKLEKTLRMNYLFSFYENLLTKKQTEYMSDYYEKDYTLAEIADNRRVSRQAVYDSIKRTEIVLEEYEKDLQLVDEFLRREKIINEIQEYVKEHYPQDNKLIQLTKNIIQDTVREGN